MSQKRYFGSFKNLFRIDWAIRSRFSHYLEATINTPDGAYHASQELARRLVKRVSSRQRKRLQQGPGPPSELDTTDLLTS
jgi:hypothetical protein